MKKEFIGYYEPTVGEINTSWDNGIFSFDTNTLLNLYRYSELTRKDFLAALKHLKGKLFLPHQAAFEYQNNRLIVIDRIYNDYNKLLEIIKQNFSQTLEGQIKQFKRHPTIIVENLIKLHNDYLKKIETELNKQKKKHPDFKTTDYVLTEITEIFEDCVGKEFTHLELKTIYAEGKIRYDQEIPPGYKDQKTKEAKGERNKYGDLIIWKQLINFCSELKTPLIFVTDDRKEDWWKIEAGKTIRPREELIKEFFDLTGVRILIYNADHFLQFAKERGLVPQLKDKTIKEIKDVRMSDEKFNLNWLSATFPSISSINTPQYPLSTAQYFGEPRYNPLTGRFETYNPWIVTEPTQYLGMYNALSDPIFNPLIQAPSASLDTKVLEHEDDDDSENDDAKK